MEDGLATLGDVLGRWSLDGLWARRYRGVRITVSDGALVRQGWGCPCGAGEAIDCDHPRGVLVGDRGHGRYFVLGSCNQKTSKA